MDLTPKVDELRVLYPSAAAESLREILLSCNGDVGKVRDLLGPPEVCLQNRTIKSEIEVDPPTITPKEKPHVIQHLVKEDKSNLQEAKLTPVKETAKRKTDIRNVLNGKRTKPNEERSITLTTAEEIELHIPYVKVFKNFLPEDISSDMVESLMSKRLMFQEKEFYIAGQLCRSSQRSVMFTTPQYQRLQNWYSSNKLKNVDFFPELYIAKAYVDQKVNDVLNTRAKDPLQIQSDWKSGICIGNHFMSNKSQLDWHSDRLARIGPLPTIASLSFGATRIFRLRRVDSTTSTIFNIPLPNNTLLIMLPGTQELFKHSVPSLTNSLVASHPQAGENRFSLTFRMIHEKLDKFPVICDKCQSHMVLRRSAKTCQYIWRCFSSYKGGQCNHLLNADFTHLNDDETTDLKFTCQSDKEGTSWHERV